VNKILNHGGILIVFCRKCGTEIANDSEFCIKCGEKQIIDNVKTIADVNPNPTKFLNNLPKKKFIIAFSIIAVAAVTTAAFLFLPNSGKKNVPIKNSSKIESNTSSLDDETNEKFKASVLSILSNNKMIAFAHDTANGTLVVNIIFTEDLVKFQQQFVSVDSNTQRHLLEQLGWDKFSTTIKKYDEVFYNESQNQNTKYKHVTFRITDSTENEVYLSYKDGAIISDRFQVIQ